MNLGEFKRECAGAALKKLFTDDYFSICAVKKVIKLTNSKPDQEVMNALEAIHCVNYGDMSKELQQEVAVRTLQTVSGTGFETEAMVQAIKSAVSGDIVCLESFKMRNKQ